MLHVADDAEMIVVGSHEQNDLPVGSSALQVVVVGDRGARGLHPMMLGATTLAVLQLSPCSVAVVHPTRTS